MKRQNLLETDAVDELAQFWDRHDLTDFEDQLEEVKRPVFAQAGRTSVLIDLPAREAERVKSIARSTGARGKRDA